MRTDCRLPHWRTPHCRASGSGTRGVAVASARSVVILLITVKDFYVTYSSSADILIHNIVIVIRMKAYHGTPSASRARTRFI